MSAPRVPHVNEVAVAGDVALLRGYSAWIVAEALEQVPGGLESLLARNHVPLERRQDALRARAALREVGASWRVQHAAASAGSGSGTASTDRARAAVASEGMVDSPSLSSREVALALGVTGRRVTALAASSVLRGRRDSGGRWLFDAADVQAELNRREGTTA